MSFNLTGSKRIIHDCCVDIYNSIQKWKSIVIQAYPDFSQICLIKQQAIEEETQSYDEAKTIEHNKVLQQLCEQLEEKNEKLRTLLSKMEKVVIKVNSLQNLTDSNRSISDEKSYIPFLSWPVSKFCSVIKDVVTMFQGELKLKENLLKEVCFLKDKQQLIFFEACWKYQPNLDKSQLDLHLDGIICELNLFSEVS